MVAFGGRTAVNRKTRNSFADELTLTRKLTAKRLVLPPSLPIYLSHIPLTCPCQFHPPPLPGFYPLPVFLYASFTIQTTFLGLISQLLLKLNFSTYWVRVLLFVLSGILRASMESDGNGVVDRIGLIDPSIAEVIVVRHGETAWNALGKLQGHLDVDLNEAGRDQAAAVAERLSRQSNISAIYSSDLKRAFETAQTIAAKCGSIQVIADQHLRERNLGDLQGLVHHPQELMKLKPESYQAFMSQKKDQEIPGGGESLDQLYQRCTSALSRIGKKHKGERVVVVTHGGVIRSLYRRAASIGRTGKILNTSVGIIHLSDDGDTWTIKSWNDISHLKETRFLKSGFGGDSSSG